MSLQVWLPLNGDLHNQGLSNLTFTTISTNTAIDNNGKIGKCCANNSKSEGGLISNQIIDLGQQQSMFCWFKFTNLTSNSSLGAGLVSQHRYSSNYGMGITIRYVSSTTGYLSVNTGTGSSRTYNTYYGTTLLQANTWYHGGYTYDGTNIRIYVNGKLEKTQAYVNMAVPADYLTVFCWSTNGTSGNTTHGNYKLNGAINDVRIYDHCLSDKEVEEIAKGLILHYKLNDIITSNTNLIYNGFGEAGIENWSTPSNVKTDIKPNVSNIYASFINNTTKDYIPIYRNTTYSISFYIKQSATSGNTYPSILPYDVDKKFIANFNTKVGFNLATMTTLTQSLNPGDTKIYVADLSQWNANSGHHYNKVAIFGYKDSTGYIYPDGTYTADIGTFGNGTNAKTNLDKTNNIITLTSAYTGTARPVGTSVCASTEGSTYFYPVGGIANSSITDWTFKQNTFSSENARLLAARYILFFTYANGYIAGITLKNESIENKIHDNSGYENDATVIGEVINSTSTPRFDHSAYINSSDPTTNSTTGEYYISANCALTTPSALTIAWWANPENGYGGNISHAMWSTTANDISSDYQVSAFNHRDTGFDVNSSDGVHLRLSTSSFVKNEWHHYTVTYDGQTAKLYKDGVQQTSVAFTAAKTLGSFTKILIGHSRAGGVHRKMKGKYSDFRVYVTALTADQVAELYHTSASIDNKGNLYARELVEN